MGVSINATAYSLKEIKRQLTDQFAHQEVPSKDLTIVDRIAPEFGWVHPDGDTFVVLWNEYYEEYNPEAEFIDFLERYLGLEDVWFGVSMGDMITGGASADEVAETLGVELADEESDW